MTVFVLFVSADIAKACSCSSSSLDLAIDNSSNIVILKLQSVEKYRADEQGFGVDGIKQSRLTVEKIFKGNLKTGQEMVFAQGGGADCVWTFDEDRIGTEYLFYLGKKPLKNNIWIGYVCSRSNTLKGAAGDLKYLDVMSKVKGKTRLSGTFTQENKPAVEGETGSYNRLAGKTILINGNGKNIRLKTDENGIYEVYDLPVGKYKVTPEKISGYKFKDDDKDSVDVEIEAGSLEEQDFEYTIDNSISGRFLDSYGKPLQGVYLDLIPARGSKPQYFYQGDSTDENGFFKFTEIPIGTYLIVINEGNEISARQPFGTFYYPNKVNREEAAEITIGAGDHFDNLIISAPTTAETVTIEGVLNFEDGKPAADEAVEFYLDGVKKFDEERKETSRAKTDKNGRFSIRILKGQKGRLVGTMITFSGEYLNCPKLERAIKATGNRVPTLKTSPIQIDAVSDSTGLELKFPFPSCKKAKLE